MEKGQYGYIKNIRKNHNQYYYTWRYDPYRSNSFACHV